jgi:hypothetical protein
MGRRFENNNPYRFGQQGILFLCKYTLHSMYNCRKIQLKNYEYSIVHRLVTNIILGKKKVHYYLQRDFRDVKYL